MTARSVFLQTRQISLCSLVPSDFGQKMQDWINDKETTKFLSRGTFPAHIDLLTQEFESSKNQTTDIQLALVDRKTNEYLGIVGLHGLNWVSRHCEFRILIGEKKHWNKGFGSQACQLMVSYAFEALNMNKVWLGVNTENERAFESYQKCGFKNEGVLRQELFRNNQYYDIARMSLLKNEYLKVKKTWSVYEWIKNIYSK